MLKKWFPKTQRGANGPKGIEFNKDKKSKDSGILESLNPRILKSKDPRIQESKFQESKNPNTMQEYCINLSITVDIYLKTAGTVFNV